MEIESANNSAWNAAEGTRNGAVSLIRYRPDLEEYLGSPGYHRRLVIIWNYDVDNASGMPSDGQSEEMGVFENTIVDALDPDRTGILVLVLTNSGVKEWHFYIQDVKEVSAKINTALLDQPNLPISLQVEDDADWNELRDIYRQVE